jgi:hypothetical protein
MKTLIIIVGIFVLSTTDALAAGSKTASSVNLEQETYSLTRENTIQTKALKAGRPNRAIPYRGNLNPVSIRGNRYTLIAGFLPPPPPPESGSPGQR